MFPNVRLMIAATLASVVALICGFGMFAVFRVSHEPFVRLPAATAPLQLVADNAARSSAGFASGELLDRRLQLRAQPSPAEAPSAPDATDEHGAAIETALAIAPAADAAAPQDAFVTAGEPTGQPSASLSAASEAPAATTDSVPASDPGNAASATGPDTAPVTASTDTNATTPLPDTATAGSDQDITATVASAPHAEPAPGGVTEATASQAPTEPPPATEPAGLTTEPADAADPADDGPRKTGAKKPKRGRVVRIRRAPRVADNPYSETQISPTRFPPTGEQDFGASQMNFQTARASQAQYFVARPVRIRHAQTAAKKPKEPNTAVGGPFVSVTKQ
jgi:hypothetical protein